MPIRRAASAHPGHTGLTIHRLGIPAWPSIASPGDAVKRSQGIGQIEPARGATDLPKPPTLWMVKPHPRYGKLLCNGFPWGQGACYHGAHTEMLLALERQMADIR